MDKDLEYLVGRVYSRACRTVVSQRTCAGTSKSYRVWGLRKSRLRAICRPMVGAAELPLQCELPKTGSVTNSLD